MSPNPFDASASPKTMKNLVNRLAGRFCRTVVRPQQQRAAFVSKMPAVLDRGRAWSMKKTLLACAALAAHIAGPAVAADWPVMAPTYEAAAPPPAVYSWWTGCYLGGNLGGAWSRAEYVLDNTV